MLDLSAEGPGFKSQPRRCRVTVLGKLFTSIESSPSSEIGSSSLKGCGGNCGLGGKLWQPTAGCMTHATCRLTAKNRYQLRNPTLGNRVRLPLPFLLYPNHTAHLRSQMAGEVWSWSGLSPCFPNFTAKALLA